MDFEGKYFVIGHIVQMTGLSERTVRSYISEGILHGEKINGVWHFSEENVRDFFGNPSVISAVKSKTNGEIYDFLINERKKQDEICLVLDLPEEEPQALSDYFCKKISEGDFCDIKFIFSALKQSPRVILRGNPKEVLSVAEDFYREKEQ